MWWFALAQAASLPHGHTVPESLTLFSRVRYTTGEGRSKEGCDAALRGALDELHGHVRGKHAEVLVAIWPYRGRSGWELHDEVICYQKGNKSVVEIEGLISRPGQGPEFPVIPIERFWTLLPVFYGTGGFSSLTGDRLEAADGQLWIRDAKANPTLDSVGRRPTLSVLDVALNRSILPRVKSYAPKLRALQEAAGVRFHVTVRIEDGELRDRHQVRLVAPRPAVMQYKRGKIGTRAFLEKCHLYHEPPTGPEISVAVPYSVIRD